ncbi:MAG: hypothetical protein C0483_20255 [Pirellula sp.]|nr:hypothetical protein [Pirellula sp.]
MKIALNIEWVGARRGGAEKYAGVIARELHNAGHDVHVFARGADPGEVPDGVTLHSVVVNKWPGCGWFRAFRFACASERALKQESFDLILGFNKTWYQDVYIAVAGAQPAVVEHSLQRFKCPWRRTFHKLGKVFSPKQWMFKLIERRQFGPEARPMHVIAPSHFVARQFHEYHGLPRSQVTVVYNGIIPTIALAAHDAEARAAFRRAQGIADDDVALLFLARNYELKGLEPLLEAFALTTEARSHAKLVVCGGRRDEWFQNKAKELGIASRVRFLGFVEDVNQVFLGSDAFVLPTFYDPCSLVVPEAMHYGLPVVTTEQNGAAELLQSGVDGFVVSSPWNLGELAEVLGRLCDDGAMRACMADEARHRAERFTMETRLKELMGVLAQYDRAMPKPRTVPAPAQAA